LQFLSSIPRMSFFSPPPAILGTPPKLASALFRISYGDHGTPLLILPCSELSSARRSPFFLTVLLRLSFPCVPVLFESPEPPIFFAGPLSSSPNGLFRKVLCPIGDFPCENFFPEAEPFFLCSFPCHAPLLLMAPPSLEPPSFFRLSSSRRVTDLRFLPRNVLSRSEACVSPFPTIPLFHKDSRRTQFSVSSFPSPRVGIATSTDFRLVSPGFPPDVMNGLFLWALGFSSTTLQCELPFFFSKKIWTDPFFFFPFFKFRHFRSPPFLPTRDFDANLSAR